MFAMACCRHFHVVSIVTGGSTNWISQYFLYGWGFLFHILPVHQPFYGRYTDHSALARLASIPIEELKHFIRANLYCPHAIADCI